MRFIILFEDNPERAHERQRLMPQHLAFLEANAGAVLAAGPLSETDGAPAGGLWLVEAENAPAALALVEADPFWPTGLRKRVRVLAWARVFADGKRLVG